MLHGQSILTILFMVQEQSQKKIRTLRSYFYIVLPLIQQKSNVNY